MRLEGPRHDGDRSSLGGEPFGHPGADPPAGARDDGPPACEPHRRMVARQLTRSTVSISPVTVAGHAEQLLESRVRAGELGARPGLLRGASSEDGFARMGLDEDQPAFVAGWARSTCRSCGTGPSRRWRRERRRCSTTSSAGSTSSPSPASRTTSSSTCRTPMRCRSRHPSGRSVRGGTRTVTGSATTSTAPSRRSLVIVFWRDVGRCAGPDPRRGRLDPRRCAAPRSATRRGSCRRSCAPHHRRDRRRVLGLPCGDRAARATCCSPIPSSATGRR